MFCPRTGPSLQTQAPRLQFCPKSGLPLQTPEPRFAVLLGLNRCGSFPLLSAPHSLFSIWTNLKRSQGHQRGGEESLANWALRTSPKFTTGVKYQFHQGFWPHQSSGNPNHPSPPNFLQNEIIPAVILCSLEKEDFKMIIYSRKFVLSTLWKGGGELPKLWISRKMDWHIATSLAWNLNFEDNFEYISNEFFGF